MSMKHGRQKIAAVLVAVMSTSSVLTAFAGTVGTPSFGRESIKVTFSSGGGYWLVDDVASGSEVSPATPENAEEEPTGESTRTQTMVKTFKTLMSDEEGDFITLFDGIKEYPGAEWDEVQCDDEGLMHQWYYEDAELGLVPVYDTTGIYSDVVLTAKWYAQDSVTVDQEIKEIGTPIATNLGDAKLEIKPIAEEEQLNHEALEAHEQVKTELAKANLELNKEMPLYPMEITAQGDRGSSAPVTITMDLPNVFADVAKTMSEDADATEKIKVIHLGKQVEILPVDVRKDSVNQPWKMTFTTGSFSPFYITVLKEAPKPEGYVTVKVRNVKNGYVMAWTKEGENSYEDIRRNLPIDEEVNLPKGTRLNLDVYGYFPINSKKQGKFETLSFLDAEGKIIVENGKELKYTENPGEVIINQDCEIVGEFSVADKKPNEQITNYIRTNSMFDIVLNPDILAGEQMYSGTLEVLQWNESEKEYQSFTGWSVRKPTEEEMKQIGRGSWDLFDCVDGRLTSKEVLGLDQYWLPMVISYQGKDYLWANEEEEEPYSVLVHVGGMMWLLYGYVMFDGEYHIESQLGGDTTGRWRLDFSYQEGDTWSKVAQQADAATFYSMYNYERTGWQTSKGVVYQEDTKLEPRFKDTYNFRAVGLFTRDNGAKVYRVDAIYDPELVGKTDNTNTNTSGNTSSGSSGSGGGGGSRSSGTAANRYTMTGSWIGNAAGGWKFLKSSGEYAANTWGWINGQYYYFDAEGNMATGWHWINGHWYYLNPSEGSQQGAMLIGLIFDPVYNAYFYADASGAMVTGWYQVGANWYYFNPVSDGRQGVLLADTYIDNYYVGADGAWVPAN